MTVASPSTNAGTPADTTAVIDNIGLLITNDPSLGDGPLGIVRQAAVVMQHGRVIAVEPKGATADTQLDVQANTFLMSLVLPA